MRTDLQYVREKTMICLCPQCTPNPDPAYLELHRRLCEARYVLELRKEARHRYYIDVEECRGTAARAQLVEDVMAEHAKRQADMFGAAA